MTKEHKEGCCEKCKAVGHLGKIGTPWCGKLGNCPCHQEEKEGCDCEEMSCQKDCRENHTHKGFFCEICRPHQEEKKLYVISLMTPVKIDINKVAQDIAFEHGGSVQIHELGGASQEEKTTTEMRVGGGADTNAIRFGPIKNLKIEVSGNGGSTEGLREENSRATTPSKWLLELEKLDKYYEKNGERGVRAYIDRKQVISFIDSLLSSERQRMVEKANQYVEGFKVKYRGCGLADSILALEEMRDYLSLLTDKEELKDITK